MICVWVCNQIDDYERRRQEIRQFRYIFRRVRRKFYGSSERLLVWLFVIKTCFVPRFTIRTRERNRNDKRYETVKLDPSLKMSYPVSLISLTWEIIRTSDPDNV
jgi:hypothetical protein